MSIFIDYHFAMSHSSHCNTQNNSSTCCCFCFHSSSAPQWNSRICGMHYRLHLNSNSKYWMKEKKDNCALQAQWTWSSGRFADAHTEAHAHRLHHSPHTQNQPLNSRSTSKCIRSILDEGHKQAGRRQTFIIFCCIICTLLLLAVLEVIDHCQPTAHSHLFRTVCRRWEASHRVFCHQTLLDDRLPLSHC